VLVALVLVMYRPSNACGEFSELRQREVRRITLPHIRVNKNLKLDGASLKTLAKRSTLGPIKRA
jgi:hypothetical protein